jgi:NAD+ kinase
MSSPRVAVVVKRSSYGRYVEDENDPEVRRLLAKRDPTVARWRESHREHVATLKEVERALKALGARAWVIHGPRIVFDASDVALVVTVGGDGTLLAASHHVARTPILGVNSSPGSSVGFFCAAYRETVRDLLEQALSGRLRRLRLARMTARLNGRVVSRRVLNEALFCHETPAAASRYILRHGTQEETQVSSGFWIGTAAGSTGAMRSAGGKVLPLTSEKLQLVVREPFRRDASPLRMTRLEIEPGREVTVKSKMRDARLFLDGPFQRASVRLGDEVSFSLSDEPIDVLGLTASRGRKR